MPGDVDAAADPRPCGPAAGPAGGVIQARWTGEAAWIPLGDRPVELRDENHTSHPSRGEILFYPGGLSEPEIVFPYGNASFASKVGQLPGNHFVSNVEGLADLPAFGHVILWERAQDIAFELSDEPLG